MKTEKLQLTHALDQAKQAFESKQKDVTRLQRERDEVKQ